MVHRDPRDAASYSPARSSQSGCPAAISSPDGRPVLDAAPTTAAATSNGYSSGNRGSSIANTSTSTTRWSASAARTISPCRRLSQTTAAPSTIRSR
ncbi:hypothetical protein [Rhodococcoides fascians]|uniref:hypothetical protein n=1 Tax=Rhodococcoides fascians TaxID=1828 RepID=UPI00366A99CF